MGFTVLAAVSQALRPRLQLALQMAAAALLAVIVVIVSLWQQLRPGGVPSEAVALTILSICSLFGSMASVHLLRSPVLAARGKIRVKHSSSVEFEDSATLCEEDQSPASPPTNGWGRAIEMRVRATAIDEEATDDERKMEEDEAAERPSPRADTADTEDDEGHGVDNTHDNTHSGSHAMDGMGADFQP